MRRRERPGGPGESGKAGLTRNDLVRGRGHFGNNSGLREGEGEGEPGKLASDLSFAEGTEGPGELTGSGPGRREQGKGNGGIGSEGPG